MAPNTTPFFPHLTSTGPPPLAGTVVEVYRNAFRQRMAEGSIRPLVLPYHLYGLIILVVYMCIPHTKSPIIYAARWPVLAFICWWEWRVLWEASSMSPGMAFVAGLMSAWGVVWSWTWLVFNRPQWDAKRVERKMGSVVKDMDENGHNTANGGAAVEYASNSEIRERRQGNGQTSHLHEKDEKNCTKVEEYYWQSFPSNFLDRYTWVVDLIINFRGPGWNWHIPSLPPLPPAVLTSLSGSTKAIKHSESCSPRSSTGLRYFETRRALFRSQMPKFILGYFVLDALKTFLILDPYFIFGPTTYSLPPLLSSLSPLALHILRLNITVIAVITALKMVLFLAPLTLCLLLGPKVFGLRGESWHYSTIWGSYSNILDKGLTGLWGGWWHQTFRFAFAAPTTYLLEKGWLKPRSATTKVVGLLCAFGISAFLHSAGSISQFPLTHPTHNPIFFLLQGLGIFIQTSLCTVFRSRIQALPRWVRRTGNVLFALGWMYATGRWLADDFARGGIWLLEPVPFSLFRGLGYGEKGTGWWCWGWLGVEWYQGERWWESGIAI